MNYSKGVSWIDDCRIPFVDGVENTNNWTSTRNKKPEKTGNFFRGNTGGPRMDTQGRFPANLLCSDDVLNDGSISKSNGNDRNNKKAKILWGLKPIKIGNIPDDQGTNSRYYDIDKWFDYLLNKLQNDTDGTIY